MDGSTAAEQEQNLARLFSTALTAWVQDHCIGFTIKIRLDQDDVVIVEDAEHHAAMGVVFSKTGGMIIEIARMTPDNGVQASTSLTMDADAVNDETAPGSDHPPVHGQNDLPSL
jgi:hypothetical protein